MTTQTSWAWPGAGHDHLAAQPLAQDVLRDKYLQPHEHGIEDVQHRIAAALAEAEGQAARTGWQARFLAAQRAGFIPAGRIAAGAGTRPAAPLANCFVQPVGDSVLQVEDGHPGVCVALAEAVETLRRGGGVGYDFSRVRPCGARVAGCSATAAGPLPFLAMFEAAAAALQPPARRAAQMAVLRCDHPDIEAFIDAKRHGGLTHFNLSVAVTDAFMRAALAGQDIELVHPAEPGPAQKATRAVRRADGLWVYHRADAGALWQRLLRSAYEHGDPGVLFIDRINADNNLAYCERLAATNVCGEQPLPPYGSCVLGSIDLTRFVVSPFEPQCRFDFSAFAALVPDAVRMLDNAITLSPWPLPQQRDEALRKRRIGLGFTGLGDALAMLNMGYETATARDFAAAMAMTLRDAAYAASVELARERGAFPLFDADRLLRDGSFASRLPAGLRERIRNTGLRHSHLLSVAPAGSISLAFADNVSGGIEPVFALGYLRHRQLVGATRSYEVEDHAWRLYQRLRGPHASPAPALVTAQDIAPLDHVRMVAAVAPWIDGSIAKTINMGARCDYAQFEPAFAEAWRLGVKGMAAFRPGRLLGGVFTAPRAWQ